MSVSRLIDVNVDVKIDQVMQAIGRKGLKLLHVFEHMVPSRDQKVLMTEFSPAIKEIMKKRHPDWFPEEE